jgi:hypothetical protein
VNLSKNNRSFDGNTSKLTERQNHLLNRKYECTSSSKNILNEYRKKRKSSFYNKIKGIEIELISEKGKEFIVGGSEK